MFKFLNRTYMQEAGADGAESGGGVPPVASPNEDYKNNPALDENGNPKVEQQPEPTPEPPKEDQPEVEEQPEPRQYDLDAPVVKQVEKLITEAGLDPATVAKEVTKNGGKPTPEMIKAIADKHGDAVASLVAEQLGGFHKANVERANARDNAIYDQVQEAFKDVTQQEGKATWGELAGWAKENIPNSERVEINKLLAQGGMAAKYAVDDLVSRFKSSETFVQSADLLAGDNTNNDFGVQPLTQREYLAELRKLEANGHVYGQSQEIAKLDARRLAGRQRGM